MLLVKEGANAFGRKTKDDVMLCKRSRERRQIMAASSLSFFWKASGWKFAGRMDACVRITDARDARARFTIHDSFTRETYWRKTKTDDDGSKIERRKRCART